MPARDAEVPRLANGTSSARPQRRNAARPRVPTALKRPVPSGLEALARLLARAAAAEVIASLSTGLTSDLDPQ
jgi:hypothetical protein